MSVIVVGVDRSETSGRAVEFAREEAKTSGASLFVVHVIPWSPYSFSTAAENEHRTASKEAELAAAREQILDPMVQLAGETGVTVTSEAHHGDPVDTIIDIVERLGATSIVIGRTGDSRVKRALFGSLPSHLVQVAPVPVTVVP